jgi:hypothetical protein
MVSEIPQLSPFFNGTGFISRFGMTKNWVFHKKPPGE